MFSLVVDVVLVVLNSSRHRFACVLLRGTAVLCKKSNGKNFCKKDCNCLHMTCYYVLPHCSVAISTYIEHFGLIYVYLLCGCGIEDYWLISFTLSAYIK